MYNRYLHNDDMPFQPVGSEAREDGERTQSSPPPWQDLFRFGGEGSPIRNLLRRFHLEELDTGDLMLLVLLFFLMEEKADDELLIALGLLLIM